MKMIIGGKQVESGDGTVIDVFNPATREYIDSVPSATEKDIDQCLDMAQEGKKTWAAAPVYERTAVMEKYADYIREHVEELAALQCKEMGKPIDQCRGELYAAADKFKGFAERVSHLYDIVLPANEPYTRDDLWITRREPLGVVLCVVPFNYPSILYACKVAPAIAMGNAVIVKPASTNPLIIIKLVEILIQCGLPDNVIQIVTGQGSVLGKKMIPDKRIDAIILTGSTETGVEVAEASARTLHRLTLELGGNDPFIVFEDADLDLAVNEAYNGRIVNAGQVCCAPKRFIVQRSVKRAFIEKLLDKLKNTVTGDPMDPETQMGCLISEKAAIDTENMVKLTVEQGAKCLYGGKRFDKTFFQPTLLDDVSPDMDIAGDMEIFGPVFPIIGFDTEEEAVKIANNSIYGLAGGIMTKDVNKGMRVASQIKSGTLVINGNGNYFHVDHAFGGYKMSGYGREGVSVSLEELSQIKTYVQKGIFSDKR